MKLFFNMVFCTLCTLNLHAQNAVVSASKMNVLYIGVANPLEIAMPSVATDKLIVSATNADIKKINNENYIATVSRPGVATITVNGNGITTTKTFRIKPIPDPFPSLRTMRGGSIEMTKLIEAGGLMSNLENFDFDAYCAIQSYVILILPKNSEPFQVKVSGSAFPEEAIERFKKLKSMDVVNFMEIKLRCPGDTISRDVGSLSFILK